MTKWDSNTIYRHYGSDIFYPMVFTPITNRPFFTKPWGGLWATPIKPVSLGWAEWCKDNDYCTNRLSTWFDFTLSPEAKVLKIVTISDILNLIKNKYAIEEYHTKRELNEYFDEAPYLRFINFKAMLKDGYDAVEIEINNYTYWSLYGWDCDSIVILNPDVIIPN